MTPLHTPIGRTKFLFFSAGNSVVVIRAVVEDTEGPVELLGEKEQNHLVVEGHGRKCNFRLYRRVHLRAESECPAHNEDKPFAPRGEVLLQFFCESTARVGRALFVEKQGPVARLKFGQYGFAFGLFALFLRQLSPMLFFADRDRFDRGIVFDPTRIILNPFADKSAPRLTYAENNDLHSCEYSLSLRAAGFGCTVAEYGVIFATSDF